MAALTWRKVTQLSRSSGDSAKSDEQLRQTIKGDPDAPQRRMLGTDILALPARDRVDVHSELIVEWRALTVALMDQLLPLVRDKLALTASFTLPQMLQGGTWSAGRKIARALRPPDGPPPLAVVADGTLF